MFLTSLPTLPPAVSYTLFSWPARQHELSSLISVWLLIPEYQPRTIEEMSGEATCSCAVPLATLHVHFHYLLFSFYMTASALLTLGTTLILIQCKATQTSHLHSRAQDPAAPLNSPLVKECPRFFWFLCCWFSFSQEEINSCFPMVPHPVSGSFSSLTSLKLGLGNSLPSSVHLSCLYSPFVVYGQTDFYFPKSSAIGSFSTVLDTESPWSSM